MVEVEGGRGQAKGSSFAFAAASPPPPPPSPLAWGSAPACGLKIPFFLLGCFHDSRSSGVLCSANSLAQSPNASDGLWNGILHHLAYLGFGDGDEVFVQVKPRGGSGP